MNLQLRRTRVQPDGIFGELTQLSGEHVCFTLEHAYCVDTKYLPKLAPGTYTCKRGTHQLKRGGPFKAFEVLDVPPFEGKPVSGILFHQGDYNGDSEGCILLGRDQAQHWITESRNTFNAFMKMQEGVDTFTLIVTGAIE